MRHIKCLASFIKGFSLILIVMLGCNGSNNIPYGEQYTSKRVPESKGNPILLDGTFSEGEWDEALVVTVHDSVDLLFQKYRDHVFIGIKCPKLVGPSIDLFLVTVEGQVHQFHVSAQLAEKVFSFNTAEQEKPPWIWGYTTDWYANEIRWDEQKVQRIMAAQNKSRVQAFGEAVYPFDGVEMQIRHSKIPSQKWRFRIEMLYPPKYDRPFIYPTDSFLDNSNQWLELFLVD